MPKHFLVNDNLTYVPEPHVEKNTFLTMPADETAIPSYDEIKDRLPRPIWDGHDDTLRCYDKAWQIAFRNLRRAKREAGFVSNFIDTAFNGYLFMWDSSFIVMFGKYASHIFDFQKTLDNFYSHQHRDGFICREICEDEPGEQFTRDDPCSTGPNILAWSEWLYFLQTDNKERLARVFDPLMAYHHWLQLHRTWQDGTYWSTGWACGMDDTPRMQSEYNVSHHHGFMSWLDTCAQQYMNAQILQKMAKVLGREDETGWLREEEELLGRAIDKMWDKDEKFYFDRYRDGSLGTAKSIGAYWTLIAGLVPEDRRADFIAHLENEGEFKRKWMIPSLSADHPLYTPEYCGWRGAVWAPTNYMVLLGLRKYGYEKLAASIAENYVGLVTSVFNATGTLHENYSAESDGTRANEHAQKDFVGWTGLAPISILFEFVFGIESDALHRRIVWHVNRTERHGIENYRLGDATVSLVCDARASNNEKPVLHISADRPITVVVDWNGKTEDRHIEP